ncbi:MAG: CHAT domain-containing protein [Scytonema sp. PMC 1069.18]|nr:CHAT domain-containing protein [Scytonema sp. PMC 1069.18]MEC4886230.1 CHAT domain-containing protein [Scytonema sp. PMC 1070.18]
MGNSVASPLPSRGDRQSSRFHLQPSIVDFGLTGSFTAIVGTKQFPLNFAEGDVQEFNKQFITILEKLCLDVRQKGIDLTGYNHNYLDRLRDLGKLAYSTILPDNAQQFFQNKEQEEQERGLSLTFITSPKLCFFWEMLYAGKRVVEPDQFWGFRYPLGRTYWEMNLHEYIRLQEGIFSAIHHQLPHSLQEVNNIAQQLEKVCQCLGLKLSVQQLEKILPVDSLCEDSLLELFHDQDFRYGMIHFACHYRHNDYTPKGYLSLTAYEQNLEIKLEQLLAWAKDYHFQNLPFVFLNACGTATLGHLSQTLQFPSGILNFGAAGVIATACTIPDNFASAFASKFYELLLGKLEINTLVNISEVLLETRLYFLQKCNNPLGLAYGLYAPSNQLLRD